MTSQDSRPRGDDERHESLLGLDQMNRAWDELTEAKVRLRAEGFMRGCDKLDEAMANIAWVISKVRP